MKPFKALDLKTVVDFGKKSFKDRYFILKICDTLILLIPKEDNPIRITSFRPMSQCNVIYKIISKVLVNCSKPLLDSIISPLQSNFILGRNTFDYILVLRSCFIIFIRIKKKGLLAFKIDLEKAYNRVNEIFFMVHCLSLVFMSMLLT